MSDEKQEVQKMGQYMIEVRDNYGNVSVQEANNHIEAIDKHKKIYPRPREGPRAFATRTFERQGL